MTITLTAFGGISPRTSRRLIPLGNALHAENVKLQSGEIRPVNQPRLVYTPGKPVPPLSIYRARWLDSEAWLTWPYDVDVVRAPLSASVEARYYWTGDGEPRMAKHSEAIPSGPYNDYPHACWALGVPRPTGKPVVVATGGASTTNVTRYYCCTFITRDAEESASSIISASVVGKSDASWAVTGLSEFPANSGSGVATYDAVSGMTTFTNAAAAQHWLRVGDKVIIGGSTVKVVESNAATPSVFKVSGDFHSATTWAREANWKTDGMKRRLYRTTGTSGSWQLVAEDVGTSYTDTLTDSQILGDELISEGWLPPPADLKGLCVHSSGALCGFSGNQFCMSEPLQPHAWPAEYQSSTDYPIIGVAVFGSTALAATSGNPYLITGSDPSTMSPEKQEGLFPCVSKRSVVAVGDGAIYASNHGLIYAGMSGLKVYTENWYTRDEWLPLNPSSMVCEYTNGRVYCLYRTKNDESALLVFDGAILTTAGISAHEIHADLTSGQLYIGNEAGIATYDPEELSFPMVFSWRSGDFVLPQPVNFGAAKIDFKIAIDPAVLAKLVADRDAAIAGNQSLLSLGGFSGAMNSRGYNFRGCNVSEAAYVPSVPPSNLVQFVLRVGDRVVFSRTVNSTKAFRLPPGMKYDNCSIEMIGQGAIYRAIIAETMDALRAA